MLPEGRRQAVRARFCRGPVPRALRARRNHRSRIAMHPDGRGEPDRDRCSRGSSTRSEAPRTFPYVALTYRLDRALSLLDETRQNDFGPAVELLRRGAGRSRRRKRGSQTEIGFESAPPAAPRKARRWSPSESARSSVAGRTIYQVGLPIHWGFLGRTKGPLVNNLTPSVLDPNSGTPEYKGFLVNLEKV